MKSLQPCLKLALISTAGFTLLTYSALANSCDKAQMIDYDYQIKETLGRGYATFGRVWLLDNQESCINSLRYGACISIKPARHGANLTVTIHKDKNTASSFKKKIKYNSSEVIRFDTMSMDVYLKIFVSNTIADHKMAGRSCNDGFPNTPRQVTRHELDNMFKG